VGVLVLGFRSDKLVHDFANDGMVGNQDQIGG